MQRICVIKLWILCQTTCKYFINTLRIVHQKTPKFSFLQHVLMVWKGSSKVIKERMLNKSRLEISKLQKFCMRSKVQYSTCQFTIGKYSLSALTICKCVSWEIASDVARGKVDTKFSQFSHSHNNKWASCIAKFNKKCSGKLLNPCAEFERKYWYLEKLINLKSNSYYSFTVRSYDTVRFEEKWRPLYLKELDLIFYNQLKFKRFLLQLFFNTLLNNYIYCYLRKQHFSFGRKSS